MMNPVPFRLSGLSLGICLLAGCTLDQAAGPALVAVAPQQVAMAAPPPPPPTVVPEAQRAAPDGQKPDVIEQVGMASWYGSKHQQRIKTASGQRFDPKRLTAAHPSLPFGSVVRVVVLKNGKSVDVVITDRHPAGRRIIDLSTAAAEKLDMRRDGITKVALIVVSRPPEGARQTEVIAQKAP